MFDINAFRSLILYGLLMILAAPVLAIETTKTIGGVLLKDPTRPAGWQAGRVAAVQPQKPVVRLDSIIFSPQRRVAVLNGNSMAEGQQSGGVKVVKIEQRRVLLEWQGVRWYATVSGATDDAISIRRAQ
ncbi:general secretion pathway protein GspB [Hahella sp. CCB-MM4]|uniref:general secretion pathway protein GspB n=1 Tax=Hahella sp. (strain CCB-MM4) TaxID=1926491 RepID=UPI001FEEF173|nr:general secretion pathway protein GspB [Hahella sp. CCB-MM4]